MITNLRNDLIYYTLGSPHHTMFLSPSITSDFAIHARFFDKYNPRQVRSSTDCDLAYVKENSPIVRTFLGQCLFTYRLA